MNIIIAMLLPPSFILCAVGFCFLTESIMTRLFFRNTLSTWQKMRRDMRHARPNTHIIAYNEKAKVYSQHVYR